VHMLRCKVAAGCEADVWNAAAGIVREACDARIRSVDEAGPGLAVGQTAVCAPAVVDVDADDHDDNGGGDDDGGDGDAVDSAALGLDAAGAGREDHGAGGPVLRRSGSRPNATTVQRESVALGDGALEPPSAGAESCMAVNGVDLASGSASILDCENSGGENDEDVIAIDILDGNRAGCPAPGCSTVVHLLHLCQHLSSAACSHGRGECYPFSASQLDLLREQVKYEQERAAKRREDTQLLRTDSADFSPNTVPPQSNAGGSVVIRDPKAEQITVEALVERELFALDGGVDEICRQEIRLVGLKSVPACSYARHRSYCLVKACGASSTTRSLANHLASHVGETPLPPDVSMALRRIERTAENCYRRVQKVVSDRLVTSIDNPSKEAEKDKAPRRSKRRRLLSPFPHPDAQPSQEIKSAAGNDPISDSGDAGRSTRAVNDGVANGCEFLASSFRPEHMASCPGCKVEMKVATMPIHFADCIPGLTKEELVILSKLAYRAHQSEQASELNTKIHDNGFKYNKAAQPRPRRNIRIPPQPRNNLSSSKNKSGLKRAFKFHTDIMELGGRKDGGIGALVGNGGANAKAKVDKDVLSKTILRVAVDQSNAVQVQGKDVEGENPSGNVAQTSDDVAEGPVTRRVTFKKSDIEPFPQARSRFEELGFFSIRCPASSCGRRFLKSMIMDHVMGGAKCHGEVSANGPMFNALAALGRRAIAFETRMEELAMKRCAEQLSRHVSGPNGPIVDTSAPRVSVASCRMATRSKNLSVTSAKETANCVNLDPGTEVDKGVSRKSSAPKVRICANDVGRSDGNENFPEIVVTAASKPACSGSPSAISSAENEGGVVWKCPLSVCNRTMRWEKLPKHMGGAECNNGMRLNTAEESEVRAVLLRVEEKKFEARQAKFRLQTQL
jgi:hypothetical protein